MQPDGVAERKQGIAGHRHHNIAAWGSFVIVSRGRTIQPNSEDGIRPDMFDQRDATYQGFRSTLFDGHDGIV